MECPQCDFANPQGSKFCGGCGQKLEFKCPSCGTINQIENKFCNQCGSSLTEKSKGVDQNLEATSPTFSPNKSAQEPASAYTTGERKHVTVLFSDLTGYTALSEKLDPEEVKEITSRIFGEISKIVSKYDGFIEKYVGDAVMAIFGIPKAHEDDPLRAAKAAREIHQLVDEISPEVEQKTGYPISMHTGINTGLVVTGEVDLERGTHGVAGDTVNLASRLGTMAKSGDILVDVNTCRQVEGLFTCEFLETATVKGKAEPIQVFKILAQRDKPVTIHRLSGLRSDLVGRNVEMAELSEAIIKLRSGKGSIFSLSGPAGTGKSRLVEEFKATLNLEEIQWIEGHAYEYSQNIPYYPLIDLLNRLLEIDEKDPPEEVKTKLESGLSSLVGDRKDLLPFVGTLYSLNYPELDKVNPEFIKTGLQTAILLILSSLAEKAQTVFFLEDLHWSDPSFVELLRRACLEIRQPAIVLCAHRATFSLLTGHQISSLGNVYHEIQLRNLSLSIAQNMLESLLQTDTIPLDLKHWVQKKAEGNPFYLEELVNTLIDSETLIKDDGDWKLTRKLSEADIPVSLHGLISGRLDRLEHDTKQILQEASVIGRDFLYDILKRISELEDRIDLELRQLEQLDLIRARSLQPEIEYMFKHALTQEIVYNGLLKKQRRKIHEQIAIVMEKVFKNRLAEFNETLAYHFARGHSVAKAVDYLIKSGEKSQARYAVKEAHRYFNEAYDLLKSKDELSKSEELILIDLLNSWGYVYYYLGEINEFVALFNKHQVLADTLDDRAKAGMYYAWRGIALFMAGNTGDSHKNLLKALDLGERTGNQKVVGYACTWLTWACAELGQFSEGISYGERAQEVANLFPADQYLFFKSLAGICMINFCRGNPGGIYKRAESLLAYGEKNANSRCKVFGHWMQVMGYLSAGDMKSAQNSGEKAIKAALDPAYEQFPKQALGMAYFFSGQINEAEKVLQSVYNFCENRGMGQIYTICQTFLAPILIAKGHMKQGTELMEMAREDLNNNQRRVQYAITEYALGEVYSQIATGPKPSLSTLAKNIGFLVKNIPFAVKTAEEYYGNAIDLLAEMDANGFLGLSHLGLGQLYAKTKRKAEAKQSIIKAIEIFQECEADHFLKQAKSVLSSLE